MVAATNLPEVSVIMPAYNAAAYVAEAIASVLAQTWRDWELIVVDDGSTDDTAAVVDRFGGLIHHIYQENQGGSAARNRAIEASTGEFIAFLDADDLWLPEFLETQINRLKSNPSAGVAYSWWCYVDARGQLLPESGRPRNRGQLLPELVMRNVFPLIAALMRRQCIEQVGLFDEQLQEDENWDLWLRIARAGCAFELSPHMLAKYRVHGRNKSMAIQRMERNQLAVLNKFYLQYGLPEDLHTLSTRAYANVFLSSAVSHYRVGDTEAVYEAFAKAVRVWPRLLVQTDTYYRLICADQPPGYRNTQFFKDLGRATSRISDLLDRVFADPLLAEAAPGLRQKAEAQALLSLAWHYYLAGDGTAVRHCLSDMVRKSPQAALKREVRGLLVRSFVGRRRVARLRRFLQFGEQNIIADADHKKPTQ